MERLWAAGCRIARRSHYLKVSTAMGLGTTMFPISAINNIISDLDNILSLYVCMCMVITFSRVWINRVRLLPILLVVS